MRVSLEGKHLKSFSLVLKTVGNGVKEAMKEHVIDWKIIGYPITKSSNWIPVIGHLRDCASIKRAENQS